MTNREHRDRALRALREAVAEALERKRRLGQYAVIWRHGRPEFIGPNPPAEAGQYDTDPANPPPGVADSGDND